MLIARPEFMLEKDIGKIIEETFASSDVRLKVTMFLDLCCCNNSLSVSKSYC